MKPKLFVFNQLYSPSQCIHTFDVIITRVYGFNVCGILFGRAHSSFFFLLILPSQHTYTRETDSECIESISLSRLTKQQVLEVCYIHCFCFVAVFNTSFCSYEFGFCLFAHSPALFFYLGVCVLELRHII